LPVSLFLPETFAQLVGFPHYLFGPLDKFKGFYVCIPSLCFQLIQAEQMGLI
jgi:hypothetical protein